MANTTDASAPQTVFVDGHRLKLTSLDKVMYPETGTTKAEVISYYTEIADLLIRHASDRPATRKRWVHGVGTAEKPGQVFFQKNLDKSTPSWVKHLPIQHSDHINEYPLVNDRATLVWLAQISALEIHVPQWKFGPQGEIGNPDRLVLDLDPGEGTGLTECAEAARLARAILSDMGLDLYPVTSGSKGIHLYAGLDGRQTSDEVSAVAHELARSLEADHPDLIVSDMKRALRRGKVFVDWSQNNANKTTVAPYSLRGRSHPMVAAPRRWDELENPRLVQLDFAEVLERVREFGDLLTLDGGEAPVAGGGGARGAGARDRGAGPADADRAAADRLTTYRAKRDPSKTPEPVPAGVPKPADGEPTFVIQEHHARRLHYDFRLERDGVLVSWAVPKGPPTGTGTNHLAVQTEDHPLEYGSFEGSIPKGEYGAGEVKIWDAGTFELEKWRDGKEVIITLHGRPEGGFQHDGGPAGPRRYALIHTGGAEGPKSSWLMHLMKDQHPGHPAPAGKAAARDDGEGTGRVRGRDAADGPARSEDTGQDTEPAPTPIIRPMLTTLGSEADVTGQEDWAFEMKWDGVRAVVVVEPEGVRLVSRTGNDMSAQYPELAGLAGLVNADTAVLDGEIVALDRRGRPAFGLLQNRINLANTAEIEQAAAKSPVHLMLFDLLQLDGASLLDLTYSQRREILAGGVDTTDNGLVQVPPVFDGSLADAVATSRELGLEGVIAKRKDATYAAGRRSRSWIKITNQVTQEVVVVGWRPGKGNRARRVGSLLVAVPDGVELRYIGRVGTGLTDKELAEVGARLKKMARKTAPLEDVPAADASDAHWVRPALVGEVQFSERTTAGKLRHPVWRGWRPDKRPSDVVVET